MENKFGPLTRGGHAYEIYKIRTDGDDAPIHGAIKAMNGEWFAHCWTIDGFSFYDKSPDNRDLVPAKKRRFKTNEELINGDYRRVLFTRVGTIMVDIGGKEYHRHPDQDVDSDIRQEWLDIFTVEET